MSVRRWLFEGRLDRGGRILVFAAALAVALSLLGPLWTLRLTAPQYREGLPLHVYAWGVGGRVETINILNHYIGMRPIREEDFPEFRFLPWLFSAAALGMAAAAASGRRWLTGTFVLLAPGLAVFILDLWRWLHQYGHDLSPAAPIRVEPFSPPVLGFYRLANFTTLSYFNWGTWLQLAALVLLVMALVRTGRGKGREALQAGRQGDPEPGRPDATSAAPGRAAHPQPRRGRRRPVGSGVDLAGSSRSGSGG